MKTLYDNCKMLNAQNEFMCFVDLDKMNWYLKKNLAVKIDEKTFKINFEPKGNGTQLPYQIIPLQNKCVVCGCENNLSKHHVVPYRFKKHFPLEYKSHTSFDLLILCRPCHDIYEVESNKLSNTFIKQHTPNIKLNKKFKKICGHIQLLKNTENIVNIPPIRIEQLINDLRNYFKDPLITINNLPQIQLIDNEINFNEFFNKFGSIFNFIKLWRIHFIEIMKPQYLSENWMNEINNLKTLSELNI